MCAPSAPEPTDPRETSAASTGTNVSTAIANSFLNNTNQITPDGTLTYDQTGSYSWTDPYTNETYEVPTFTATQTLSDNQQAIADQTGAAELNLSTLANDQSAFLNDYMAEPFSYGVGEHETWAGNLYDQLNAQSIADSTEALRTQLANQGIRVGTEAYDRAMTGLQTSQQNARNQFMLDSQGQGFSQAQATRNQPINEITALLSGSQVSQPNYVSGNQSQIATTDNGSVIANYDNAVMNQWQQEQAAGGSAIGALGGLFTLLSDGRLKTDKRKIAETKDGIGIYSYRFKGNPETHIGLMAQEVLEKRPEAVHALPNGVLTVDYAEATK